MIAMVIAKTIILTLLPSTANTSGDYAVEDAGFRNLEVFPHSGIVRRQEPQVRRAKPPEATRVANNDLDVGEEHQLIRWHVPPDSEGAMQVHDNGRLQAPATDNSVLLSARNHPPDYNAAPQQVTDVIAGRLIAYYPMQASCADTVGNFSAAVVGDVTFSAASGKRGNGASFTAGGYCAASGFNNHEWGSIFSICAWVRRTSVSGTMLVVKTGTWAVRLGSQGCDDHNECTNVGGGVHTTDGGVGWADIHSQSLIVDVWTHLCITYDGAALVFYRNGQLVTQAAKHGRLNVVNEPLLIGSPASTGYVAYTGYVDEVKVYSKALTLEEVEATYSSEEGYDGTDVLGTSTFTTTTSTATTTTSTVTTSSTTTSSSSSTTTSTTTTTTIEPTTTDLFYPGGWTLADEDFKVYKKYQQ